MNSTILPVPKPQDINSGLTSPSELFMIQMFGTPGTLTQDCSEITNSKLKQNIVSASIANGINVHGHKVAIASLQHIFANVKNAGRQDLLDGLICDGMLCCRKRRGGTSFSNHSWGCAIDFKYTHDGIDMGDPHCFKGLLDLYTFFHANKWYWGASFQRPDSMHFEPSTELIMDWKGLGLI